LRLEGRRIARQHTEVFRGGQTVGRVTSGTLSPTLGTSIAMAFITSEHATVGTAVEIVVGSKRVTAEVVNLPFYKRA
jgi:aminomethyltransferase